MDLLIKGIILGFVMVMPGMSGGTVFLIFGLYENMVKDILKLNIKPYIPLAVGIIGGIFVGGFTFALVFENYRDATVAFLLGCLLASIKSVLKGCPKINGSFLGMLIAGVITGAIMVGEPLGLAMETDNVSLLVILIGGALSSAAMIIPGIPGSSVLILMGIYDIMLFSIKELEIVNILVFGTGSLLGIFLLLNILAKLYDKYKGMISYFFAGLIAGSSRGILPSTVNLWIVALFIIGFALVWIWSDKEDGKMLPGQA